MPSITWDWWISLKVFIPSDKAELSQLYWCEKQLSCVRRCYKPSKTTEAPPDSFPGPSTRELHMCCIRQFKTPPQVRYLSVPTWTHWTFFFRSSPHPWWIKTAITLTNGHQNFNKSHCWILGWWNLSSSRSSLILSFSFFPYIYFNLYFYTFIFLYCYR